MFYSQNKNAHKTKNKPNQGNNLQDSLKKAFLD